MSGLGVMQVWMHALHSPCLLQADVCSSGPARAGRPPFAARSREAAEGFFIDALARWRDSLGLGKVRRQTRLPRALSARKPRLGGFCTGWLLR